MGVDIFQAFRPRDGEPGTVRAKVTLRELLTFREPNDAVGRAIRNAQLEALVRLVPVTVASQLLAVGLVAWSMRGMVADIWLALWFGFAWLLCGSRGYRALRLRQGPGLCAPQPA